MKENWSDHLCCGKYFTFDNVALSEDRSSIARIEDADDLKLSFLKGFASKNHVACSNKSKTEIYESIKCAKATMLMSIENNTSTYAKSNSQPNNNSNSAAITVSASSKKLRILKIRKRNHHVCLWKMEMELHVGLFSYYSFLKSVLMLQLLEIMHQEMSLVKKSTAHCNAFVNIYPICNDSAMTMQ